jgi:hypothetical protein
LFQGGRSYSKAGLDGIALIAWGNREMPINPPSSPNLPMDFVCEN